MRILHLIHGYPPAYNAGSEVYTQTLAREQVRRGHTVSVFSRDEDPFRPVGAMRASVDDGEPRVALHLVNVAGLRDRYRHALVDQERTGRAMGEIVVELEYVAEEALYGILAEEAGSAFVDLRRTPPSPRP